MKIPPSPFRGSKFLFRVGLPMLAVMLLVMGANYPVITRLGDLSDVRVPAASVRTNATAVVWDTNTSKFILGAPVSSGGGGGTNSYLVQTNYTLNQLYTNGSQAAEVSAYVKFTEAVATVGGSSMSLMVDQAGGTTFSNKFTVSAATVGTSQAGTNTWPLIGSLYPNATLYLTNDSVGAGNGSALVAGSIQYKTVGAGTNGATGATGASGTNGVNGTNGTNGVNGATGATGATGPAGGLTNNAQLFGSTGDNGGITNLPVALASGNVLQGSNTVTLLTLTGSTNLGWSIAAFPFTTARLLQVTNPSTFTLSISNSFPLNGTNINASGLTFISMFRPAPGGPLFYSVINPPNTFASAYAVAFGAANGWVISTNATDVLATLTISTNFTTFHATIASIDTLLTVNAPQSTIVNASLSDNQAATNTYTWRVSDGESFIRLTNQGRIVLTGVIGAGFAQTGVGLTVSNSTGGALTIYFTNLFRFLNITTNTIGAGKVAVYGAKDFAGTVLTTGVVEP